MPIAAKVNAAYPPSAEVQVAQERLLALLGDDAKAKDDLRARADARMTLRALTCAKDASISRTASLASVRALGLDRDCFRAQDVGLQSLYGVRAVGVLLARTPLRPFRPTGSIASLPGGKLPSVVSGTIARDANVAVLRDSRGDGMVVEIPGATPIAPLPRAIAADASSSLSPNGRVFATRATPMQPGLAFYDSESGNKIWEESQGSRVLDWLPEVGGFLIADRNGGTLVADGLTGSIEPHSLAPKGSSYSAHLSGPPARSLLGTERQFVLVEHVRTAQGIQSSLVKEYRIETGHGVTSGDPVPMQAGRRVVFASVRDIGWLDLDDGTSGVWKSAPYFGIPFAKLDETHIMFDSIDENDRMTLRPWSFDIAAQTVAPIDLGGPRGLIVNIGDRVGFMRRGEAAWFGDQVRTGTARPLDDVLAAYQLQLQLAKLKAQSEGEDRSRDPMMAPGRTGLEAAVAAQRAQQDAAIAARAAATPGMSDVPADAQVHMVGIYEGKAPAGSSGGRDVKRHVRVSVRPLSRPIVLVLASYEPVTWIVSNSGARIAAVLLSGYSPSTVVGVGNTPVLRIGTAYAYSRDGGNYTQLSRAVALYTGTREIKSFQGVYAGSEFSVGGF